jgi:hypothetical protein
MDVLVDTCIWSLAFRRHSDLNLPEVRLLKTLIADGRVQMIGAIRQEILSGVQSDAQFKRLRKTLRAFPDLSLSESDYELAARFYSLCRAKGIQGSNTDFLICAVAVQRSLSIFTNDNDFLNFQKHFDISCYPVALTPF